MGIKNKIVSFAFILAILSGCLRSSNDNQNSSEESKPYSEAIVTRIKFNFKQSFEIREIKKGTSISDILISGIGFQNNSSKIKFENSDPIEQFYISDLNNDGFEELYIITRSVGSGSYANIIGVASVNGKSYKNIYVPDFDDLLIVNKDFMEGYKGHDSIFLRENKLFREFTVCLKNDISSDSIDIKRSINYKLLKIDESYTLQCDGR